MAANGSSKSAWILGVSTFTSGCAGSGSFGCSWSWFSRGVVSIDWTDSLNGLLSGVFVKSTSYLICTSEISQSGTSSIIIYGLTGLANEVYLASLWREKQLSLGSRIDLCLTVFESARLWSASVRLATWTRSSSISDCYFFSSHIVSIGIGFAAYLRFSERCTMGVTERC